MTLAVRTLRRFHRIVFYAACAGAVLAAGGPVRSQNEPPAQTSVEATDQLQKRLNLARNQAQLGSTTAGGQEDQRFRQLVAQYGQDFAAAAIYAPSSPPEVFRPSDRSLDAALIWDEQAEEWYRVKGDVPVETIFRDVSSALGRPPTPGQLKYLADNYGQVEKRQAMVAAFTNYLREAAREESKPQNQAFAHLADRGNLLTALGDAEMFRVKFVYDGQFRSWLLDRLDQLRTDLVKQGPAAQPSLRELDALLDLHGTTLDSQWAQGVLPAVGAVRVVAWFSDSPKKKFVSTWRFEKEKVAIDIDGGHGHGTRKGNVVRSEGSLPGRNCTATDVRTFKEGGGLTFSAVYTCALDDGTTKVSEVSGGGTWQIVSARPKVGQKSAK